MQMKLWFEQLIELYSLIVPLLASHFLQLIFIKNVIIKNTRIFKKYLIFDNSYLLKIFLINLPVQIYGIAPI